MGGEWDEQAWPSAKLPTRQMIDAVTANHPAFLSRYDGHASSGEFAGPQTGRSDARYA